MPKNKEMRLKNLKKSSIRKGYLTKKMQQKTILKTVSFPYLKYGNKNRIYADALRRMINGVSF